MQPSTLARAMMFIATSLAMAGNYYVYDSIGTVADLLAQQRGFSDTQIGTLNAIYSLGLLSLLAVALAVALRAHSRQTALAG